MLVASKGCLVVSTGCLAVGTGFQVSTCCLVVSTGCLVREDRLFGNEYRLLNVVNAGCLVIFAHW